MPWHLTCVCGKLNITEIPTTVCTSCKRILIIEEGEPMPRPNKEDTPRKVTLSLPSSIMTQTELILIDPVTLRTSYGAMSALVASLLKRWLEEQTVVNKPLTTTTTTTQEEPK
jgi:hypothetical protein